MKDRVDTKRYMVITDALAVLSGLYRRNEVLTEEHLGAEVPRLLSVRAIEETDYDLHRLREEFPEP